MDILAQKDYRKIIVNLMESQQKQGTRSQLAKAIDCSPSWITRALSGDVQLTPDQTLGICLHFGLSEVETDYLLLLVEIERASTLNLKNRLQQKMKTLQKTNRGFQTVKSESSISENHRHLYYSTWIYPSIHVACMIQDFTIEELSHRTRIEIPIASKVLAELVQMGLVVNQAGKWRATSKNIHLSSEDSAMSKLAHVIWRNRTIQFLQEGGNDGLHYSAIHCLSKNDVEIVRDKLKEIVLDCRKTINSSESETLAVLCLDWYSP